VLTTQGTQQLKLELHSGETPQKLTGAENRARGGGGEGASAHARGGDIVFSKDDLVFLRYDPLLHRQNDMNGSSVAVISEHFTEQRQLFFPSKCNVYGLKGIVL
jgi:hypothetical protein